MANDNVIPIKSKSLNARDWTPREMLLDALREVDANEHTEKKALILWVSDENDEYAVGFHQAGMTVAECILLCEMGKDRFKAIAFE